MWWCALTRPGVTRHPRASMTRRAGGSAPARPVAWMTPSLTQIQPPGTSALVWGTSSSALAISRSQVSGATQERESGDISLCSEESGGEGTAVVVVGPDDVQVAQNQILVMQTLRIQLPGRVPGALDQMIVDQRRAREAQLRGRHRRIAVQNLPIGAGGVREIAAPPGNRCRHERPHDGRVSRDELIGAFQRHVGIAAGVLDPKGPHLYARVLHDRRLRGDETLLDIARIAQERRVIKTQRD